MSTLFDPPSPAVRMEEPRLPWGASRSGGSSSTAQQPTAAPAPAQPAAAGRGGGVCRGGAAHAVSAAGDDASAASAAIAAAQRQFVHHIDCAMVRWIENRSPHRPPASGDCDKPTCSAALLSTFAAGLLRELEACPLVEEPAPASTPPPPAPHALLFTPESSRANPAECATVPSASTATPSQGGTPEVADVLEIHIDPAPASPERGGGTAGGAVSASPGVVVRKVRRRIRPHAGSPLHASLGLQRVSGGAPDGGGVGGGEAHPERGGVSGGAPPADTIPSTPGDAVPVTPVAVREVGHPQQQAEACGGHSVTGATLQRAQGDTVCDAISDTCDAIVWEGPAAAGGGERRVGAAAGGAVLQPRCLEMP